MAGMSIEEILANYTAGQFKPVQFSEPKSRVHKKLKSSQSRLGWSKLREFLPDCPYGADFVETAKRYGREMDHGNLIDYTAFSIATKFPWCITIVVPGSNMYMSHFVLDGNGNSYDFSTKDEAIIAMAHMARIAGKTIVRENERCRTIMAYLKEKGIHIPGVQALAA